MRAGLQAEHLTQKDPSTYLYIHQVVCYKLSLVLVYFFLFVWMVIKCQLKILTGFPDCIIVLKTNNLLLYIFCVAELGKSRGLDKDGISKLSQRKATLEWGFKSLR